MRPRRRWWRPSALVAALGLWGLCVLGWVALLAVQAYQGDLGCELYPGSSYFGSAQWQWAPPGQACTWQLPDGRIVTEARTGSPAVPGLLVLWPVTVLAVARARR